MEYLVYMEVTMQIDAGSEAFSKLSVLEAKRSRELAEAGVMRRLWRVPGCRANWGIWTASTTDALHAAISSLPLYPYLRVTVHPLATHANDPGLALEGTR